MLQKISEFDELGWVRDDAEHLLKQADRLGISGIEKLAIDFASPNKFSNLLAELRFAILLADGRFGRCSSVSLNLDSCQLPDLKVQLPNGQVAFVEVTTLSPGHAPISELLEKICQSYSCLKNLRISITLGPPLSPPGLDRKQRDVLEDKARSILECGTKGIVQALNDGSSVGRVRVFEVNDNLQFRFEQCSADGLYLSYESEWELGDDWQCSLLFMPRSELKVLVPCIQSSVYFSNSDGQTARFLRDLRSKVGKWKGPGVGSTSEVEAKQRIHANDVFIVAIQNDDNDLSPTDVLSALTGSRCGVANCPEDSQRMRERRQPALDIRNKHAQWSRLLDAWGYGDVSNDFLINFGAYYEESWAKQLSGVLVAHNGFQRVQWFPNPFANHQGCNSELMDLLPIEKGGFVLSK